MKFIRQPLAALALLVFAGSAAALDAAQYPLAPAAQSTQAMQNSTQAMQNIAVALPAAVAAAAAPVQPPATASTPALPQASYTFSIGAVPEPKSWLLVLSGLALAGWVARRRLGYSF
jgi:hypothetical protein